MRAHMCLSMCVSAYVLCVYAQAFCACACVCVCVFVYVFVCEHMCVSDVCE